MNFSLHAGLVLLGVMLTIGLGSGAAQNAKQETGGARAPMASLPAASPISGQVTFLYCNDIAKASGFYFKLLGKKPSLDFDWVKIYPVTETFSVGLVDAVHGALRPAASKPVMLSFVVQNPKQVDEWIARVKALGAESSYSANWQDLKNGQRVYSLSFKDSEGYSLEIFCWAK